MPLLDKKDVAKENTAPGMERWSLVDGKKGAQSITVAEVVLAPGAKTPVHYHPTEEAMVILEGELEAILGDELFTVRAGNTVIAPPTIKHGFVNRSNRPARLFGIHPTANVTTIVVE
ncbi:MAG: cupin domain-containing protein [Chloroflexi bacterium]|nr:cupin domain-containing protein [Chloroflexota bacterium]